MTNSEYIKLARERISQAGPKAMPMGQLVILPNPSTVAKPSTLPNCSRLGKATGKEKPWVSCVKDPPTMLPIYECSLHGECTTDSVAKGNATKCCRYCNDHSERKANLSAERLPANPVAESFRGSLQLLSKGTPIEWVSVADLAADAVRLASMLPKEITHIVGMPRSGMIPASIIATMLHLPLWQITKDGQLSRLGAGYREASLVKDRGRQYFAVIDDTVYSGNSMMIARNYMGSRNAVYAAVYVNPKSPTVVKYHARQLPSPHLLEWNLANNGPFYGKAHDKIFGSGVATDLDGIIVHDEFSGGPPGTPYMVPKSDIAKLIVTGRPESHRQQTESMLRSLGVRWHGLKMFPGQKTPEDYREIAEFKASVFLESNCGLFLESYPAQAELIYQLSGRPVICPREKRVYQ
jgi:hypoxanthine phosphoribosyltransferase